MASVPNPIGFNYSDQAFSTAWNTPSLALVAGRGVGTPTSPSGSIWAPGGSYGAQYPTFRQAGGILFAYVNVIDNVIKSGESRPDQPQVPRRAGDDLRADRVGRSEQH